MSGIFWYQWGCEGTCLHILKHYALLSRNRTMQSAIFRFIWLQDLILIFIEIPQLLEPLFRAPAAASPLDFTGSLRLSCRRLTCLHNSRSK